MPPRSELPGEIKRRKFIKALKRLGFVIDTRGGAGSHFKAMWPKTQKTITVPSKLRRDVLYYVLKEIESMTGVTLDDIKRAL